MSDVARAVLVGRLTRDPDLNDTGKVLTLGLAVNRRQRVSEGVYEDAVSFFDIKVLGGRAAGLAKFLKQGRQVAVDARVVQERWEDKNDGSKRSAVKFIADEVTPLGSRDENSAREALASDVPTDSPPSQPSFPEDDSIPF